MLRHLLTLLCAVIISGTSYAQTIWSDMPESGIPSAGERRIQPAKFRAVQLNVSALKPVLSAAPERFSPAAESGNLPVLSLPLPGGGMGRFQLEETPVMHPDLQAKYPQIRTYTGRGLDDATAVLKCDLTPWGFHAMVQSSHAGTFYIDPAVHGNDEYYLVYNRKDYLRKKDDALWTCATPDPDGAQELEQVKPLTPAQLAEFQGDTKLRRYRLAMACTGEYATFHGGTKPLVLAAMNTTMNRVNGVYERDFAVTMQLIANNDLLIYLNGATDPYSNNDGGAMLGQNQTTCNNIIGAANYDIGHVFSTGGGGIAGLSVVCGTSKANGVTGGGSPVGDPFDIDYVAHEMGHQFGGNHTFGNCGGNVNNPAATEPGSGTTIMAYAGICGGQNVANNSEDIFHGYNILEMGAFIYTGNANNCPVKITTTNNNPDVNAGPNRVIPKSTPFALTAIGSDVNGDTLTYTWEQMDWGVAPSPPVSTATVGPLFRSYKGNTSPTRYFPRLPDLVNNINSTWEELPGVARSMTFRVVARDNDWYAGCTDEDDVQITVAGTAGPFLVTAPNTNVVWLVGSPQTVTWDVANTTAAPVSCANVRITLSIDGGFTYPIELAASVPNNGSASITVPNNVANTCRVRVESVGNIFFDISNTNFRIELPPAPTFLLSTSLNNLNVCAETEGSFTTTSSAIAGFSDSVTVSVSGAPAGAILTVSPNPITPTGTATITISGVTSDMAGNYPLTVTATGGSIMRTATVQLNILPGAPTAASVSSPANGATGVSTTTALNWNPSSFSTSYYVEVATNPSFSAGSIVLAQTTTNINTLVSGLSTETVYYWRVQPSNDCGTGSFSATGAFQTGKDLCGQNFTSSDVPKAIDQNTVNTATSTLSIPNSRAINDVNVNLTVTHTYTGDLLAHLISPAGDTTLLFDQPGVPVFDQYGCPGDNANLTFDSQAAQDAATLEGQCNGTPPSLNGTFQPIGSLNLINGKNAAGTWKLLVSDNYPEDGGAITGWSLSFCFPDSINAGNILVNNPLSVSTGQSEAIFQSLLAMETSGIPAQGLFTLRSLPEHGTLFLNGTPMGLGDTFTQEDINNNVVTYTHNGDTSTADEFQFDALDENNDAWVSNATFLINIVTSNLAATASETAGINCNGAATGQITVTATGLDGNYTYSLNNGPSQSSNVFDGLPEGAYTVVVTGQFGFTVSTNPVILTAPPAIAVSTSVNNDDLTVTASGGTGVLEYSINGVTFQPENEFLDLSNGVYTVTVRDENGCTASAEVTVSSNLLLVSVAVQQEISCNGANNGALVVTVNGGQTPYSYSLNGGAGQSSNVFSDLPAGDYTVVVTDNQGLITTATLVVLNDPAVLTISATSTLNVVSVTANGGTGALEYSLDGTNFQGSNQFTNLPNGTYTLTVRDANGCTSSTEVTVFVTPLSGSMQATEILCFGGAAAISVDALNGISPYEYQLNNGAFQSSNSFNGVPAGTYSVTIRDAAGTTFVVGPITITEPNELIVVAFVSLNDATVAFTGGTAPYSFGTNAPNPDLQNLPNGTYNVTATDANGCVATTSFTVNVAPLGTFATVTNVLCNGGNSGTITANGFGGIPPYQFSLNGGSFQTSNVFSNLAAGNYALTIRDAEGNLSNTNVGVNEPFVLALSAIVAGSTITATATGGAPAYQYSLNGGTSQSSGTFSNLAPGTYTVVATDANGCTVASTSLLVTTGTIEPTEAWGLAVSPNPSTGLFVLSLQNAPDALRAEVFDATGRLMLSHDLNPISGQLNTTLDLQDMPQGTYFLRLTDGQNWGGVRLSKVGQ